ncbi:hypothetical protein [Thalassomonas sp. M1454]|uniref:hypothetical protein n=1 Tax=Thalassomonas sp. M1454 TaxID=2594477 RepID=UPI0011817199|nr:hypothetical protein [Thalassomonas sp. M1454]TRX56791.1 hypothetical protein FNN08_04480 [Thalassomonas sp. M1454]
MSSKKVEITEKDKINFSYNVIATLIAVLGEEVSAQTIFEYLSNFDKFQALAISSSSANLQIIAEHGKSYFEEMIVIPTPNT